MRHGGRIAFFSALLPLLLFASACIGPDFDVEEPLEVDSCDQLIEVGIELVNDYVYTLQETDLGETLGDPEQLPTALLTLNVRGEELDARIVELDCDAVAINQAVVDATAGIESDDPIVAALLASVRGGIVTPILPTYGEWLLESGTVTAEPLALDPANQITLVIEREAVSGFAGCNGYFYPASLVDGVWSWPEGTATVTELLCEKGDEEDSVDVMATETAYLAGLEAVARYTLTEGTLILTGDGVELRFIRDSGE